LIQVIDLQKPLSDAEENKGLKLLISGNCDIADFSKGFQTQRKDHDCEHTTLQKDLRCNGNIIFVSSQPLIWQIKMPEPGHPY
jgi:hypothetical protein